MLIKISNWDSRCFLLFIYFFHLTGGLWCLNSTGELFCYDIKLKRLLPVELPSGSGVRCLQPKYQSLWLLAENGSVYVRRGITNNCLQGMWWQALNLTQFGK